MKIALKDLHPNPFREEATYPVHREKIDALKASIRAMGFWDNVMVRKAASGSHYELAFGHHRLLALKELSREKLLDADFQVDVAVRKLEDADMLRIMANENVEEYKATADIQDDTVRVAREFIAKETKTPLTEISPSDISQFLGGSWSEAKVRTSLQRLGLFDRGALRREQLKGLSRSQARSVQGEVGRVEKTMLKSQIEKVEEGDEEVTDQDRKRIRAQVQKAAGHVAQALCDHLRNGGSAGEVKETSLRAQTELIPEDAKGDDRRLSTIDAAAQSVSAREFQRKVELLLRYREHMSEDAHDALKAKLRELSSWCKQVMEQLEKR